MRPTLAIVATAIWGVLLIPGLLGALMSAMFFDAPGSMNNPVAWINAGIVVSFPLLCLLSIAGSWLVWALRKRHETRGAAIAQVVVACVPLLPVACVVVALVVGIASALLSGQPMGLHSTVIKH